MSRDAAGCPRTVIAATAEGRFRREGFNSRIEGEGQRKHKMLLARLTQSHVRLAQQLLYSDAGSGRFRTIALTRDSRNVPDVRIR